MYLVLIFTSADPPLSQQHIEYQRFCMFHLIGGALTHGNVPSAEGLRAAEHPYAPFRRLNNALDVCKWLGVTCLHGKIRSIQWSTDSVVLQRFHPRWIPPTVRIVQANNQPIHLVAHFSTRFLPRDAQLFEMRSSSLEGELDLRTLPERLSQFIVPGNWLWGTVDLRRLPQTFVFLDARCNSLELVVADNTCIPDTLENAYLGSRYGPRSAVELYEVSGEILDDRIYVEQGTWLGRYEQLR